MIISTGGLPQGRTTTRSRERPEELGFDKSELQFLSPIDLKADIVRMGFDIYVDLTISTTVVLHCGRCLEAYQLALRINSKMLYVPAQAGMQGRTADGGVFLYRNSTIDLADRICEAIREELPMKPLCRPDCRGLCPHCGRNLNEGPCGCVEKDESFHPFEGLRL